MPPPSTSAASQQSHALLPTQTPCVQTEKEKEGEEERKKKSQLTEQRQPNQHLKWMQWLLILYVYVITRSSLSSSFIIKS